jgi:aspartyl-tRNA(Asn)/glutamyl-tRNA(Gln) amidotransferase subunit B
VITSAVATVLDENPGEVARYLAGEEKVVKFLMGQVMRALKGKGEAQTVQRVLTEQIEARRG